MKTHTNEVERMRTLYALMIGAPIEKIDMRNWRTIAFPTDAELLHSGCGSAACAVGLACAYPEFQAQGLSYHHGPHLTSEGGAYRDWRAVEVFFGLTLAQCLHLFGARDVGLHAKKGVLKRIRQHLLSIGAITYKRSKALAQQEKELTA